MIRVFSLVNSTISLVKSLVLFLVELHRIGSYAEQVTSEQVTYEQDDQRLLKTEDGDSFRKCG